jgi:hypothetical protein
MIPASRRFWRRWLRLRDVPGAIIEPARDVQDMVESRLDSSLRQRVEMPPPPSFLVMDDLRSAIDSNLSESKQERMLRKLKSLITSWFTIHANLWIPEDTRTLLSSYLRLFRIGLANDQVIVESDVVYAGIVEQKTGVQYTKSTARDHAASHLRIGLLSNMSMFIQTARRFVDS